MTRRLVTVGVAVAALLGTRSAAALKLTVEPAGPVPAGQPQTFRVAAVDEAVGAVTIRWNFGDGTVTDPAPERQATHTYKEPGHYTIIVLGSDDASGTSAVLVQTVFIPPTARPPANSSSIIIDAERHRVWNVNPDSDSVSVTDADTLTRVREAPVGREPHALAQAPDGSIWVASQMSDEVVVLNRDTADIEARIALPYASQPRALAFGPTGMAYVSLFATGKLVEIDGASRKVGRQAALGPTPAGVSVTADGRILVTRFLSPADHGEVWVVRADTLALTNTIVLPFDQGPDTQSSGRGVPNYVASAIISPDGAQAWVSAKKDNMARGPMRDGLNMNADSFVRTTVATIDLATEKEIVEKRQDIDNRSMPVSVAFSPLGDYGFVLALASNWIGIMDAYSTQEVGGIKNVGNAPDGLAVAPDGKMFVNAFLSREVIVYDVSLSLSSTDHAAPEPMARIRTVDVEPLSPQVLLGKQVFFNAADTRMGHAGYISCVSCHFGGFSDGRIWDFTNRGEGLRNTRSLLGVRGMAEGRIHWSANMDEIQDFERDIRDSFDGSGFMPDGDFNARKGASGIYDTFGAPAAGVSPELDALSAYITSLDKVGRSPFRNPDGSFTKDAREGRKIFERAGCPMCHSGPDFTDSNASGTLHDVGTLLPTSGTRLGGPLTGIDTPSLKGVWQTAPYLHDGRAATLTEIFTKYNPNDKMGFTSNLTQTELGQLVEYLQELDDVPETPASEPPGKAAGCGTCSLGSSPGGSTPNALDGLPWLVVLASLRRRRRRRGR